MAGLKDHADQVLLARHRANGFCTKVARPAAIYSREDNIFDMEGALFLCRGGYRCSA